MDWLPWLRAKLGTSKWCVAYRLTDRLRAKGYEVVISNKRYTALRKEWRFEHPTPEVRQIRAMMQLPGVTDEMTRAAVMAIDALDQQAGRF